MSLVSPSMQVTFQYLGSHSGLNEDKVATLGVPIGEGMKINALLFLDSPVSIECTVVDSLRTGSHEMFVGKIEYVHADANLVDKDGKIDWEKIEFMRV